MEKEITQFRDRLPGCEVATDCRETLVYNGHYFTFVCVRDLIKEHGIDYAVDTIKRETSKE